MHLYSNSTATVLDSCLILSTKDVNYKKQFEQFILTWYEQISDSEENSIKNAAIYMLAGKYIKNSDYDMTSNLMDRIPEINIDKTSYQSEILIHQGKISEAATMLEAKLLQELQKVQTHLYELINIEWKAKQREKEMQISTIAHDMVSLFGLWNYSAVIPFLQIALYRKDVTQSIQYISSVLKESHKL